MRKFSSSKNKFHIVLLSTICIFLMTMVIRVSLYQKVKEPPIFIFYILIPAIIICLLWILFDTKYIIKDKILYYSSGPIRGKIDIEKIRKVKYHSGWYVPTILKPALDTNGLLITYSQFDDMYISPKEQEQFVAELLSINPNIIVEN